MTSRVTIKRLSTGVPGLDAVLGGGLPEYSFNLIAGQPGCGKTTLAHQIMFALATPQSTALYFTVLGEPPLKMLRYQQQFEHFDIAAIDHRVSYINLADDAVAGNLDQVLQRMVDAVAQHEPALVFVDSFRSIVLTGDLAGSGSGYQAGGTASHPANAMQLFLQQLAVLMTTWQATTFLIGEYVDDSDPSPVFTVADGLIWLRQSVQGNSMVRKLEILKMRGQPTLAGLHTFRITQAGVHVFAPINAIDADPLADLGPADTARAGLGTAGLDEMMGGGLPRGFSLLVAGPSGSGKSILASAFLAEGARCGEAGVIAAFEQRPNRLRSQVMANLIEQGRVTLVDSTAVDLCIGEVVALIMNAVHQQRARRVVIDSLSGFELALAPTFRADFRESMLRLVTALSHVGVTVLMTSELEDRYTDLRFSPYGTAFLTDAIIVQRYIEVEGRLRRVMAVAKVRASEHSNELREYTIDAHGIHLGRCLDDHDGLLGGHPVHRPPLP